MSTMETTIQQKVDFVYSSERLEEWDVLRNSLGDVALINAPADAYVMNMRAAYLQLVSGTMVHAIGGMAALQKRAADLMKNYECFNKAIEERENAETMGKLKEIYNNAFGSSRDGIRAMVSEFNRRIAGGRMSFRSQDVLYSHLMAVSLPMLADFRQADEGQKGHSGGSTVQGSGCMLMFFGGALAAFSIITMSI